MVLQCMSNSSFLHIPFWEDREIVKQEKTQNPIPPPSFSFQNISLDQIYKQSNILTLDHVTMSLI